ncbi:tripartite tricarboxylate transporter TctB family protein [Oceanobacillus sp. Castelsardo]|uniref:tripartite tricarboxylate transporter TctB family protein n=1 Tax=Oceanobacillus sp. Castelsardo TaxID=1851204 RepID=UPI000838DCF3|nr:tripartite tricarboxylate transporter TctB family protein [Oceanobacillus sp. Castelsardo]
MFKTVNQRVSIVLLLIAALYLIIAYQIPSYPYTEVDADVIPKTLGWLLVLLSASLFFLKDSDSEEQKERRKIPKKEIGVLLVVAGFILVYIALLEIIGFVLVTGLFIFFCSWFLGYKKYITNAIVSILFPIIMYLMFTELLKLSLPSGILPF